MRTELNKCFFLRLSATFMAKDYWNSWWQQDTFHSSCYVWERDKTHEVMTVLVADGRLLIIIVTLSVCVQTERPGMGITPCVKKNRRLHLCLSDPRSKAQTISYPVRLARSDCLSNGIHITLVIIPCKLCMTHRNSLCITKEVREH